jgi:hypothetical protein
MQHFEIILSKWKTSNRDLNDKFIYGIDSVYNNSFTI